MSGWLEWSKLSEWSRVNVIKVVKLVKVSVNVSKKGKFLAVGKKC